MSSSSYQYLEEPLLMQDYSDSYQYTETLNNDNEALIEHQSGVGELFTCEICY